MGFFLQGDNTFLASRPQLSTKNYPEMSLSEIEGVRKSIPNI